MGRQLQLILNMARVEGDIMAEDVVVTSAVAAESTTAHLKAITSTVLSHILRITILHTVVHILLLEVIPHRSPNGVPNMGIRKLPTPTTLTTLNRILLPSIRRNLLMALPSLTLIKGPLLPQTRPSGVVDSRLEVTMVMGDHAVVIMIAMDQSPQ